MLLQVFSILFLFAQCAADEEYTMVTKAPSEDEMMGEVLSKLNDLRRSVVYDTNASNLHWLKWDLSLAWMAQKATDTCENTEKDVDGFIKMRLRLSNQKAAPDHLLIHDIWINIKNFAEHIKEYGADIDETIDEFSKFYDLFRSDWTRIGCAFQVCKDLMTGEDTNLVCLLGPKTARSGPIFEMKKSEDDLCTDCECEELMCKEPVFDVSKLTDEEFQKSILEDLNGARSKFAQRANASYMNKLVWDEKLAASAHDSGSQCPDKLTHGSNYREVPTSSFWNMAAGLSPLGDLYGVSTVEESYKEVYDWSVMYTILWPEMRKVGCSRTPNCPSEAWCHIGEIAQLDGKMYEKGALCSKCKEGQSCGDGLCV
ncbi:hypothetical protein GCK72_018679 [Caenorhabditis remanei]|uniref:SCP domain-containing protein n=1 Tax=Caenorhabditis remanei TaxID=31234 RepID=A0A6A5GBZ6_CAERE|nr:hypothetical protein GCK72_018679 [Caenorhabditis remanei]KAF1752125.1 hypothetical protein GCK72_018679 [Caenorhabditis remanei]